MMSKTDVVPALTELTDQWGKMDSTNHISIIHTNCHKVFKHKCVHTRVHAHTHTHTGKA